MTKFFRSLVLTLAAVLLFAGLALAATNFADPITFGNTVGFSGATTFTGGVGAFRRTNGATFTTADPNPSRASLRAAQFWLVDTTANAVDLDFSNDADLQAADIGTEWLFIVSAGGTNALTVTQGASGVTVTTQQSGPAATCEDVGDRYRCMAIALEAIVCETHCAD